MTDTIPYTIKRRWFSSLPPITVEIGAEYATASEGVKLGAAVRVVVGKARAANLSAANLRAADLRAANLSAADLSDANLRDADLSAANLRAANLSAADLSAADLSAADLRDANLRDANLSAANLRAADLRAADLSAAYLSAANLSAADLRDADLSAAKNDLWAILLANKNEVSGLLTALREGRVDGSTYHGPCACLVGTIANVRGVSVNTLPRNSSRPAERWFLAIREGDTPENSAIAKITAGWIEEFQRLMVA